LRREVPPPGAADSAWQAWADRLRRPATIAPPAAVLPLRRRAGPAATLLLVSGRRRSELPEAQLRLLARAIADAGLQEDACHRTDIHAGGRGGLVAERARLRPDLVVALGASAAEALLERPVSLPLERGRVMPMDDGSRLLVTADPASILALPDSTALGREYRRLVADLLLAVPFQRRAA
jgi:hypothetical protein